MSRADLKTTARPVTLVHSSDLHIDSTARPGGYDGIIGLTAVLEAAREVAADVVLLAGDTFDNDRVDAGVLTRAHAVLSAAPMPVVLLPGNHDPLVPDSIFHRSGFLDVPQASIIGHSEPESLLFEHLSLEINGRPHRDARDMDPLPELGARRARWRIVAAHGHFVAPEDWRDQAHRSWIISESALAKVAADYVALGHWDRPTPVGDGTVRAYYSGSPDLARTVNVVRLDTAAGVTVERTPLRLPYQTRRG